MQIYLKKLGLRHTEDGNFSKFKELNTKEGEVYDKGNLYVPDDLEILEL